MTTYWLVWDGAPYWITQELVRRGSLPGLASVQMAGMATGLSPSAPSCQTPPGLACLFTGTQPADNGVTGFWVPGALDNDMTSQRRGFEPGVCHAPMLWQRLGKRGVTSILVHAPWTFHADNSVDPGVLGAIEAYSGRVARERFSPLKPGDTLVWDDLEESVQIYRPDFQPRVILTSPNGDSNEVGSEWTSFPSRSDGAGWYRTVTVGSQLLCVRTAVWTTRVAGFDSSLVDVLQRDIASSPFCGESTGALYRDGIYGRKLVDGGDGAAEEVLISASKLVAERFLRSTRAALSVSSVKPGLVVIYVPITDDLGHELIGLVDPSQIAIAPETREHAWDLLARGYRQADNILAEVLRYAADDDTVVVSSDHGMAAVTTTFYPNNLLVSAGLAVPGEVGDDGADPGLSLVFYHLANNGMLVRGTGTRYDLAEAVRLLKSTLHSATGQPGVDQHIPAAGIPVGEDVIQLIFGDGVLPSAEITDDRRVFGPPLRSAAHTTNNGDPRLNAIFAAAGPSVKSGSSAPAVRHNGDVAAFVERSLLLAPQASDRKHANQIRLCVIGQSGAGKSTFFEMAKEFASVGGLTIARLKLAEPLYTLQQAIRSVAGVTLPADRQDQLLMESLASHLRRLNPRALVAPVIALLSGEHADLVIIDDLRDPYVDFPELFEHGFRVVRIEASSQVRQERLCYRGDETTSGTSASGIDQIPANYTILNDGSIDEFRRNVNELLEVLVDSHR